MSPNSTTPDTPDTAPASGSAASAPLPVHDQRSKKSGKLRRFFKLLLIMGLLSAAGAGVEAYRFITTPAEDPGRNIVLEINPGESFDKIANRLHKAGVVSSVFKFKLLASLRGEAGKIQAGVFEFSTGWNPREVLHQLVYGKPTLERLTIREGLPWWQVAAAVEAQGFARAEDFKAIIHDRDFLREMGIPFDNAEGFLYPDTYFLKKPPEELTPEEARKVAARMINTFWQRGAKVWGDTRPGKDELFYLVVMASLVEKETGVPEERPRVAGVYANRLQANMLLQCDPTIIYGLGEEFDGRLRKRHLEDAANAYNTYKHAGLPPGPICSPGLAALQASNEPEQHKFYYFVATGKPDGTHYFNTNLNDHNRDVRKYLAELKIRQKENKLRAKEEAERIRQEAEIAARANATDATDDVAGNAAIQKDDTEISLIEAELELSQNATRP